MLLQRQSALRFSLISQRSLSLSNSVSHTIPGERVAHRDAFPEGYYPEGQSNEQKQPKMLALTAQQELDKWNANNKIFNRPLSPHLSVYEWSIPMAMSGFYRISSFAMGKGFITAPLAYVGLNVFGNGYQNPADHLATVAYGARNSGYLMLGVWLAMKSQVVMPLFFHCVNGCRHLGWDQYAYGIRHLSDVYQSAYIVLAVTAVLSLALTVYHKDNSKKE